MGRYDDVNRGGYGDEAFRAQPQPMREVAAKLEELAASDRTPQAYAAQYVDFDPSGGAVMERFVDLTTGMDTGVAAMMRDIVTCVKESGVELASSADLYESLDAEAAARLDKTYWQH